MTSQPDPQGLPFVTPELPGIGGDIKQAPAHFQVQEIPLYLPEGSGEHLYLTLRREGWTTRALVKRLAAVFGLRESEIGYAGLKDKQALVTQTFSLHLRSPEPEEAARLVADQLPVEVLSASRHRNKLKPGHLLGNRFRVLVSGPHPEAADRARAIAEELIRRGVPNYFGQQRFGMEGDNAERGRRLLLTGKGPRQKWLRRLLLNAFQSELFNLWLARRIADGLFEELLEGDLAKKLDTGGLFVVEDLEREQERFAAGEITYTGPIYGAKMLPAQGEAGRREEELLQEQGLEDAPWGRAGLKGGRRRARLLVPDLELKPSPEGLWFGFSLPKGSYATSLLREFLKGDSLPAEQ